MILLVAVGAVLIILALTVENESTRSDLFRLLGLLLTAAIALSSTSYTSESTSAEYQHEDYSTPKYKQKTAT